MILRLCSYLLRVQKGRHMNDGQIAQGIKQSVLNIGITSTTTIKLKRNKI